MHYGQICNQGIGCTVSSGDRTMADYFGSTSTRPARSGSSTTTRRASTTARTCTRSASSTGKTLTGKRVKATASRRARWPTSAGDAQWPHYSPTGAGPNQPQLDFTNVALEHGRARARCG